MRRKGICFVCGCTEADGCAEGCAWANVKQTLCTACAPLSSKDRAAKRVQSMTELDRRLDEAPETYKRIWLDLHIRRRLLWEEREKAGT